MTAQQPKPNPYSQQGDAMTAINPYVEPISRFRKIGAFSFHVYSSTVIRACMIGCSLLIYLYSNGILTAADDLDLEVRVEGGMINDKQSSDIPGPIHLGLHRRKTEWEPFSGTSYHAARPYGRVTKADGDDRHLNLSLAITFPHDGWTPGGNGVWHLKLIRGEGVEWIGSADGEFRGQAVTGKVTAMTRLSPSRIGETVENAHPRLLFRPGDLPWLRQCLDSPLGRAVRPALDDLAGQALLWKLTGDRVAAENAWDLFERQIPDQDSGSKNCRGRLWASRLEHAAFAYDWCHDAWDERRRYRARCYLADCATRILFNRPNFQKEIGWTLAGDMGSPIYYGAAVAALALWGEPGLVPVQPLAPKIAIPDQELPEGLPVEPLIYDAVPRQWIAAGPLQTLADEDPLRIDGRQAIPHLGLTITSGGVQATFAQLMPTALLKAENPALRSIDLTIANNRRHYTTMWFATGIAVEKEETVVIDPGIGHDVVAFRGWLGGVAVPLRVPLRLAPGKHCLVLAVTSGGVTSWAGVRFRPRLVLPENLAVDPIESMIAAGDAENLQGAGDATWLRLVTVTRRIMDEAIREMVGSGGFQNATQGQSGMVGPHKYPLLHRRFFGVDLHGEDDIVQLIPRKIFSLIWPPDNSHPHGADLQGKAGFESGSLQGNNVGIDVANQFCAALAPMVEERLRPGFLWAWLRWSGAVDATNTIDWTKLVAEKNPYTEGPPANTALWTLVTWPHDVIPSSPTAPTWPLSRVAPESGWVGWRNAWGGPDETIVQVLANSHVRGKGGFATAGTFRLYACGQDWTTAVLGHEGGAGANTIGDGEERWNENVVVLPEDPIFSNGAGRVMTTRQDPTGGAVSIDMNDIYSGLDPSYQPYDGIGGFRHHEAFRSLGITGWRTLGCDYSGKSGAPVVIAVADRIQGSGRTTWLWQLPWDNATKSPSDPFAGITISGNTLTRKVGDAMLNMTVVSPAKVRLETVMRRQGRLTSGWPTVCATAIGETNDAGDWFVVVSVSRGTPPKVTIDGSGLSSRVSVGGQVLALHDKVVVFGSDAVSVARPPPTLEHAPRIIASSLPPWRQPGVLLPAPESAPPPLSNGDGVYALWFDDALGTVFEGQHRVAVYLERRSGAWSAAFAWCPIVSMQPMVVDTRKLILAEQTLKGAVTLSLRPDPWEDPKRPLPEAILTLDATMNAEGLVTGRHQGTWDGSSVTGILTGLARSKPIDKEQQKLWLRCERLVTGGKMMHNLSRGALSLPIIHGTVGAGVIIVKDGKREVNAAGLTITSVGLVGAFTQDLSDAKEVGFPIDGGVFTWTFLQPLRVGDLMAGRIEWQNANLGGKRSTGWIGILLPADAPDQKLESPERRAPW